MQTDRESNEIKKSMTYDLLQIIESQPQQETYSAAEVKKLISNYIAATTQNDRRRALRGSGFFCCSLGQKTEKLRIFEFRKETLACAWLFLYNTWSVACGRNARIHERNDPE